VLLVEIANKLDKPSCKNQKLAISIIMGASAPVGYKVTHENEDILNIV